ncbi:quinon protein alcohol dehydrogenase-like superfamily [Suillus americanus]|nr:quinon protein alcohol dehydrogenase-like superfamily [Suillus americanus]
MVTSVCWSPDGGRLGSGFLDGTFRVWNVQSRKTILGPINVGQMITSSCYSTDGEMISIQPDKSTIQLWNIQTHQPIGPPLHQEDEDEVSSAVSSRRRRILTCSEDGSIRVWDLESGTQVGDAWKDEGSGVMRTISLSPDGTMVASGSHDGAVRLWDVDTGKVVRKWIGHTRHVWSVCWSPDGGRVASGSMDHTLRVWDVRSRDTIIGPIEATSNMPVLARYSPDGRMIATSGLQLKIWDANTGELLKKIQIKVVCMAWISDGKTLISYGDSGIIRKLDTATWTETARLEGHKGIKDISLSVNERILASVSANQKTARLWDLKNDKLIGPPLYHEGMVRSAVFSEDGKFLATGCDDGRIYTWDVSAIIKEAGLDNLLVSLDASHSQSH